MTLRACLSTGLILWLIACGGDDFETDGEPGGAGQGGAQAGEAGQAGAGQGGAQAGGEAGAGQGGAGQGGESPAGGAGQGGDPGSAGQGGASGEAGAGGCTVNSDCDSQSGPCRSSLCSDKVCVTTPINLGKGCPIEGGFCDEKGECTVPQPHPSGCSDGKRDGFLDASTFPHIAACAGSWSVPGLGETMTSTCGRHAGNDASAEAPGCSAVDLCTVGWHVCRSATEVVASVPGGSQAGDFCPVYALESSGKNGVFYATGQSGTGNNLCTTTGSNDIFGCGTGDFVLNSPSGDLICSPFNAVLAANSTPPGVPWTFDPTSSTLPSADEKGSVVKLKGPGGVLCCRD